MLHTFNFDDKYYMFDNVSSTLLECDEKVHLFLKGELEKLSSDELAEITSEIEELKNSGLILKEESKVVPPKSEHVKALCLHICHDCNLRCEYCFASEGTFKGEREYMSEEVGLKAVDFLIANSGNRKILEMDFFGGEPLMNLDVVKKVVEYAKEQGKKNGKTFLFTMTTNAVLLDDSTIDYLNEEMENVVLSLDGRKETHDKIRKTRNGKGSFDIIIDNIRKFVARRGNKSYYIRGTFTKENLNFKDDVLFMADNGFKEISLEPVVLDKCHRLFIGEKDLPQIKEEYKSLAREYIKRKQDGNGFNFFHFAIDLEGGPCISKRINACGAGNEYFSVTPKGEIFPCHQFADNRNYLMGNVFDGKIDENIRKVFKEANLYTKEKCKDCFAKYHCSGGCCANNVNFNGDINKPYEITCEMMKTRIECALHILATLKEEK